MRVGTWNLWGDTEPVDVRMAAVASLILARAPHAMILQEVTPAAAQVLAGRVGMHSVAEGGLAVLLRGRHERARVTLLPSDAEPRALITVLWNGVAFHSTHLEHRLDRGEDRAIQAEAICAAKPAAGARSARNAARARRRGAGGTRRESKDMVVRDG